MLVESTSTKSVTAVQPQTVLRTEFSQGDLIALVYMLVVLRITNASLIFPISAKCTAQYKRFLSCIRPVKNCRLNLCFYIFLLLPLNLKWSIYPATESCHQLKSWSCSLAPAALTRWEQDSAEVGEDSSTAEALGISRMVSSCGSWTVVHGLWVPCCTGMQRKSSTESPPVGYVLGAFPSGFIAVYKVKVNLQRRGE